MLTTLNTSYTDTRAADLAWTPGPRAAARPRHPRPRTRPGQTPVATARRVPPGASGGGAGQLLGDRRVHPGQQHPAAARRGQAGRRLGVRVRGPRRDPVARLRSPAAPRSCSPWSPTTRNGLAGVFPGSPHAFTAMLAQRHEGQVHWRTWHAYPQDGQLVATRTPRCGVRTEALSASGGLTPRAARRANGPRRSARGTRCGRVRGERRGVDWPERGVAARGAGRVKAACRRRWAARVAAAGSRPPGAGGRASAGNPVRRQPGAPAKPAAPFHTCG